MKNLVGTVSAVFVFLLVFYHISGVGNYIMAQRVGIVLWHLWAVSIAGCALLAVFSGYTVRLPKASMPYVVWCAGFVLMCGLSLLIVKSDEVALDTVTTYIWFFSLSVSLVILVRTPALVRACGYGAVLAVVVLSVLTIMEFLDPDFQVIVDRLIDDVHQVGELSRAGAFHINPNNNGNAIALGLFCGVLFVPTYLRLPFILLAGVAIFGTVSRSALTLWALVTLYCFFMGYVARGRIVGKVLGIIFIGGLGVLLVSGQVPVLVDDFGLGELLTENMRERLSGSFFSQDDGSTTARLEAAEASLAAFYDNPLLGVGLGGTDNIDGVGSHNLHLKIAAEMGLLGYLLFVALFFIALHSGSISAIVFVTLYFIIGMAGHSLLYFTEYAVLIPLGIIFIPELIKKTSEKKRRKRRRKKSSVAERQVSA